MGLLCDYFLASSDEHAASVSEWGPTPPVAVAAPSRRRWFGRKSLKSGDPGFTVPLSTPQAFSVVDGGSVMPAVQMGTLEALLTGRSFEEILQRPDYPCLIASWGESGPTVERLPDSFVSALAGASDERLAEVAVPWSQTEEFWGRGEPDALAGLLRELAALAREAGESDQRMYCWVCL